jgi:hypothetical protein
LISAVSEIAADEISADSYWRTGKSKIGHFLTTAGAPFTILPALFSEISSLSATASLAAGECVPIIGVGLKNDNTVWRSVL